MHLDENHFVQTGSSENMKGLFGEIFHLIPCRALKTNIKERKIGHVSHKLKITRKYVVQQRSPTDVNLI